MKRRSFFCTDSFTDSLTHSLTHSLTRITLILLSLLASSRSCPVEEQDQEQEQDMLISQRFVVGKLKALGFQVPEQPSAVDDDIVNK